VFQRISSSQQDASFKHGSDSSVLDSVLVEVILREALELMHLQRAEHRYQPADILQNFPWKMAAVMTGVSQLRKT
jgi:hypothetical protein